jgi:membrane-bound lytic murein transglycosylase D
VASPEPLAVAVKGGATRQDVFPRPPGLEARIAFWKLVFTRYEDTDLIIHDSMHVQKIYTVLDLSGASPKQVASVTTAEKQRIRALLLQLDARGSDLARESLGESERMIFELFRDVDEPRKFRAAAERIRGQAGLREQFAEGIRGSRRYLPEMEAIFRRAGLPVEITRLPLIESCFNLRAYSWKGAAGIWQFMQRTGRLHGLQIDRLVDERRDPLRATAAAARYLTVAYAELGAWPLAITAYNHGSAGIARGVRAVGTTDIVTLVEEYNGRTFGFAGQNFYAEFLAAVEVDREPERYFGALAYDTPRESEDVLLQHTVGIAQAADAVGLSRDVLAEYNPALSPRILKGDAAVPRGYRMRVPAGRGEVLEVAMAALAAQRPQQIAQGEVHRVRRGETLAQIARTHGMTVADLMAYNDIDNARRLRVGQLLKLPGSATSPPVVVARATPQRQASVRHRIRRGETLQVIARHYGTTVAALKRENGIRDARRIRENQIIKVPGRKKAVAERVEVAAATIPAAIGTGQHRVQRGETLDRIASAYGTTADALKQENGIGDPRRIKAGQVLRVPRADAGQRGAAATQGRGNGKPAQRANASKPEASGDATPVMDAAWDKEATEPAKAVAVEPLIGGVATEKAPLEALPLETPPAAHAPVEAPAEAARAEGPRPEVGGPAEMRPETAPADAEEPRAEEAPVDDAQPAAPATPEAAVGSLDSPQNTASQVVPAVAEPLQEAAEPVRVRHEEAPQDTAAESLPENGSPPAQAIEPTAPVDEKVEPRKRSGGGRRHRARRGQDLTHVLRYPAARV